MFYFSTYFQLSVIIWFIYFFKIVHFGLFAWALEFGFHNFCFSRVFYGKLFKNCRHEKNSFTVLKVQIFENLVHIFLYSLDQIGIVTCAFLTNWISCFQLKVNVKKIFLQNLKFIIMLMFFLLLFSYVSDLKIFFTWACSSNFIYFDILSDVIEPSNFRVLVQF